MMIANLIVAPANEVTYSKNNAYNKDIINLIHSYYDQYHHQVKNAAKKFKGATRMETAENLYNWLRNSRNVRYVEDKANNQVVKSPRKFIHDGYGDCKSFSVFAASVLHELGMSVCFRYACYDGSGTPSHVYVQTFDEDNNPILVDGTVNRFNYERKSTYGVKTQFKNYCMKLTGINGPNVKPHRYNKSIGRKRGIRSPLLMPNEPIGLSVKLGGKVYTAKDISLNNIVDAIKTYNPISVLARNGFLAAVRLNFRNLAANLARAYGRDYGHRIGVELWEKKFGGDADSLLKAIQAGQHKKALFGSVNIAGGIGVEPVTTGAAGVAAIPIIKEFIDLLKSLLGSDALNDTEKMNVLTDLVTTGTSIVNTATGGGNTQGPMVYSGGDTNPPPPQDNSGSLPGWLLPAGLAAAFLILKK